MAGRKPTNKPPAADLDAYQAKRDFGVTGEPAGAIGGTDSGRLFVIQKHAARRLHYDLRLEMHGILKSWALPRGPSLDPAQKMLAVHVEDHPIEYATFEGIIPQGEYGGGTVMVWDQGEWEPIGDPDEAYAAGDLKFRLHGQKLRGEWVIARMTGKASEGGKNWLLIKKRDDESRPVERFNVLGEMPFSVASGRGMEDIAADPDAVWTDGGRTALRDTPRKAVEPRRHDPSGLPGARPADELPRAFKPQLATLEKRPPDGEQWLHEIKLDGYRLIARLDHGNVTLLTRNGHDWTARIRDVARTLKQMPLESAILDGELVIFDDDGISDFQALQNAFRGRGPTRFTYCVFDIPFAQGLDLRNVPLLERKGYLESVLAAAPTVAPIIQYSQHIVGKGPIVFDQATRSGLEGIVSKSATATYESRRTLTWLKFKSTLRQEFVVGGFTPPSGSRSGLGALLIGQHDDTGRLVYSGRVGTGFSDRMLQDLARNLAGRLTDTPAFVNAKLDPDYAIVTWVEPEVVVEVEFGAWTDEGFVRHASCLGLRPDVDPKQVRREVAGGDEGRESATKKRSARRRAAPPVKAARPAGKVVMSPASPDDAFVEGVRISNPRRTVYPEDGVTKLVVAEFYRDIAEWILPHVTRRPLSLVRCPLGLAGEAFYQREIGEGFPDPIRGLAVGDDHAILIDDLTGLLSLVQMGVLEIHAWGCRVDNLEKPDYLTFDLDPGPGIAWGDIVGSAVFIREYLEKLGLRSYVKTSGGKGVHVTVPLVRRASWSEAKSFAHAIAQDLARIAPRNFVAVMTKTLRQQRIFIDYLRNQHGSTSIAPYSTRARNGATVSTPLSWEELSPEVEPAAYNVRTVPKRLAGLDTDPWEGFREMRQSITAAAKKMLGL